MNCIIFMDAETEIKRQCDDLRVAENARTSRPVISDDIAVSDMFNAILNVILLLDRRMTALPPGPSSEEGDRQVDTEAAVPFWPAGPYSANGGCARIAFHGFRPKVLQPRLFYDCC
jgi:hypothetical protein